MFGAYFQLRHLFNRPLQLFNFLFLSGPAGGGSVDWMYGQLGVKYSYAVSMQDRSGRGERFVYVGKGLLQGLKAFVKAMQL